MFHCAADSFVTAARRSLTWISTIALLAFAYAGPASALPTTVATYDFEDGTTQGWGSFNNATSPVNSTAAAASGTHSLLTTTNPSGSSSGPSIVLSGLIPGATYQITGQVMLADTAGGATAANFTVDRSDP